MKDKIEYRIMRKFVKKAETPARVCFATFFIIKLPFRFLTFSIVNFI